MKRYLNKNMRMSWTNTGIYLPLHAKTDKTLPLTAKPDLALLWT